MNDLITIQLTVEMSMDDAELLRSSYDCSTTKQALKQHINELSEMNVNIKITECEEID